jgi:hypothetical protein
MLQPKPPKLTQPDWNYVSELRVLLERARERGDHLTASMIEAHISKQIKPQVASSPDPE